MDDNPLGLPADWLTLIAVAQRLADAPDATSAALIDALPADTPKEKVLSRQQSWVNKYQRCAARGLIVHPYRIRRVRRDDGGYDIEAALDLTPAIEHALYSLPDMEERRERPEHYRT